MSNDLIEPHLEAMQRLGEENSSSSGRSVAIVNFVFHNERLVDRAVYPVCGLEEKEMLIQNTDIECG